MPLLYGEGERAFLRLQETILGSSSDHSIFAWPIIQQYAQQPVSDASAPTTAVRSLYGLLADSPAAFETCGSIKQKRVLGYHSAYTITNRGLSVDLYATLIAVDKYMVVLECDDDQMKMEPTSNSKSCPALMIFVVKLDDDGHFARIRSDHNSSIVRVNDTSTLAQQLRMSFKYRKITMCISLQSKHLLDLEASDRKIFVDGFQIISTGFCTPENLSTGWRWVIEGQTISFMPDWSSWAKFLITSTPVVLVHKSQRHPKTLYMFLRFNVDGHLVCIIETAAARKRFPGLRFQELPDYSDETLWSQQLKDKHFRVVPLWSPFICKDGYYENSLDGVWVLRADPVVATYATLITRATLDRSAQVSLKPQRIKGGPSDGMLIWEVSSDVFPLVSHHGKRAYSNLPWGLNLASGDGCMSD